MRRVWKTVLLGTFTSLFMGVWFYLALRNKYHTWDQLNLVNTALWAVVAGFSATAAWLFLQGVQNFRPQLRHAYRLLCIGLIIFGIAQVQYPVASYIHAEFWYLGGFIAIPYLAAAVYMFWGVRSFASLVELRSHWMSWWVVIVTSLAVVPIVVFLPHAKSDFPAVEIVFGNALSALDAVFMTFGVVAILRVRAIIARIYSGALMWLAIALGANVLAGVHYIITNLLLARVNNWYWNDGMATWPFLLGAVLLMRAGYAMVLVNQAAAAQTSGADSGGASSAQLPMVDIIIYLAELASKPQELDQSLNILRKITAHLGAGQKPTPAEDRELIGVYHTIEHYLTTEEPLRSFTKAELRHIITHEFNLEPPAASKLWPDG